MMWLGFFPQNNHTGVMCLQPPETLPIDYTFQRSLYERIVYGSIILILSLIGFVGNVAVVIAIFKDPGLQIKNQISNILIVNLAITDICTCSLEFWSSALTVFLDTRVVEPTLCRIQGALNLGMMLASLYTMFIITIDRYIAVTRPLHYHQIVNEKRLIILCALSWLTFFNAGPVSALLNDGSWIAYDYPAGICDFRWLECPDSFYWVVYNDIIAVIPMPLIVIMNIKIVKVSKGEAKGDGKEAQVNAKVLKSMMIVVAAFVILAIPITSTRMMKACFAYAGLKPDEFPMWVTMAFMFMQLLASIVNPLIYGLFRKDFRDAFAKLFKFK